MATILDIGFESAEDGSILASMLIEGDDGIKIHCQHVVPTDMEVKGLFVPDYIFHAAFDNVITGVSGYAFVHDEEQT